MGEFLGGVLRDKMNSVLEENPALKKRVEDAPDKKDEFIHLRDAKFFLPSQRPVPGSSEGGIAKKQSRGRRADRARMLLLA